MPKSHDADRAAGAPDETIGDELGRRAEDLVDAALTDEDDTPQAVDGERLTDESPTLEAPVREAARRRSGKPVMASPQLAMPHATAPDAITLFVHGGDVTGNLRMRRLDPAYLRMVPFARDLERRTRGRIGGALLRLAVRGWNDPDTPAVDDTLWALGELRRRYPNTPLALAGHSMGGRVVLHLAGHEELSALVGLAPWASEEYDAHDFLGTPTLIVHGRQDSVTDPDASADLVKRIQALGGEADFVSLTGWHAMLWRPMRWHRECSDFLASHLLDRPRAGLSDSPTTH